MKKIISILLILGLLSIPVLASDQLSTQSSSAEIQLTKNQINILKAYGLSEKEIADIDLETIRKTLKNGTIVDSSWFAEKPEYGTNDIPSHLEKIIASKHLSERQMKGLRQRGYTYDEIAEMEAKTIESIVGPASLLTRGTPPSGYNCVSQVPDGGGTNEWFNPDVDVDTNSLNWYVSASKNYAKYIFNEYSNPLPTGFAYSYYLYGEWDDVTVDPYGYYDGIPGGTHEGVDVKHPTSGKAVRSATNNGIVVGKGSSYGGYVQVYDSYLNETITYMHIGTTPLNIGNPVSKGTAIGSQSTSYNHAHFQAKDGNTTSIPSGQDDTLYCRIPYGFMTWYL